MSIFTHRLHARNAPNRRPHDTFGHRFWNDPYLDWLTMVIVGAVVAGIGIGIGTIVYFSGSGRLEAPPGSSAADRLVLFDTQVLGRILVEFDAREVEQNAAQKGYTGVADPSI